jgi:pimeloyl-ACP methyl ester carboxylesterase
MKSATPFRFPTASGVTLAGDRAGPTDGPLVVLLHGGGQTRHSWTNVMKRLVAAGYGVLRYDARGHGESDWSANGDYRLTSFADDLKVLVEGERRPVVLVGASLGGITAFYAVGRGLDADVRGLVLVDIVINISKAGSDRIRRFMTQHPSGFDTLEAAAEAVGRYDPDRPIPTDFNGLMKNLRRRDDGRLHWHWDPRFLGDEAERQSEFAVPMTEVASQVRAPVLLLRGERSDVVDDAGVDHLVRLIPQAEVRMVPSARHMVAGDPNDDFSNGIIEFIARSARWETPCN